MTVIEISVLMVSVSLVILIGMCCVLLFKVFKLVIKVEDVTNETIEKIKKIWEPLHLIKEGLSFLKKYKKEDDRI